LSHYLLHTMYLAFVPTRRSSDLFANFVDVLRLAADDGDRSRPILCDWAVLSDNMSPVTSSCGVVVQPHERLGDPRKFDYIVVVGDRKSTRLNSSHVKISYAVFCL